jgi:pimeloyl-ACP methyl ester carboxylesterase
MPGQTGSEARKVALKTGVTIEFTESGASDGVPVIFLHGFTDSRHSFNYLVAKLPAHIHAIVLSQRGHGNSDKPSGGYKPEDFSEDLHAFMEARGLANAVIVGHSMGSTIAQNFALRYPGKVKGLVLMSTITDFSANEVLREFGSQVALLKDPIDHAFAADFQKSTLSLPVPESFLDTVINETLKVPAVVWRGVVNSFMEVNYMSSLAEIKCPVLILYGSNDNFSTLDAQQKMNAAFNNPTLKVYQAVGHALHWEKPEAVAQDITAFVRSKFSEGVGIINASDYCYD